MLWSLVRTTQVLDDQKSVMLTYDVVSHMPSSSSLMTTMIIGSGGFFFSFFLSVTFGSAQSERGDKLRLFFFLARISPRRPPLDGVCLDWVKSATAGRQAGGRAKLPTILAWLTTKPAAGQALPGGLSVSSIEEN